jgi:hypothetical protein
VQHLRANTVEHGESDISAVFSRVDMHTEGALAERRSHDLDDGVGDDGCIGIGWNDRGESLLRLLAEASPACVVALTGRGAARRGRAPWRASVQTRPHSVRDRFRASSQMPY